MTKSNWLKGIIIPMVTPLDRFEEIDTLAAKEIVNWLVDEGIHVLFVDGSTGEMAKLKIEERKKIIKETVDQLNGRIPLIAGVGDTSTKHAIELAQYAKDVGANAGVVMSPYFWKYDPDTMFSHYRAIGNSVDLPLIVYDNPDSNNILSFELIKKIAKEVPNIMGVKDSSFDMIKMGKEVNELGEDISVIQGIDQLIVPSLAIGADGAISGVGNICPRFLADMYTAFTNGDLKKAANMQKKFFLLCNATEKFGFEEFIKKSLNLLGHRVGNVRSPSRLYSHEDEQEIVRILKRFENLPLSVIQ
jgi:4-hydroxy-tetrahydrodipicolinate synthase